MQNQQTERSTLKNSTKSQNWGLQLDMMPFHEFPAHDQVLGHLNEIIDKRELSAVFQPIVNLNDASVVGHEGFIRGPQDSVLHMPLALFDASRQYGILPVIEHLSRQVVLETFAGVDSPLKLFLNVSPESLTQSDGQTTATLSYIRRIGLNPRNIIIELTESSPSFDYNLLRNATEHYRGMGFEIAMDDLGEGFSSLRLWSELHPDYVKIDKHFIQNIDKDPVKLEFVRSIQQIAQSSGAKVIAEGIETEAQYSIIKDLKIAYGQGYFFAKPSPMPDFALSDQLREMIRKSRVRVFPNTAPFSRTKNNLNRLHEYIEPVAPDTSNDEVYTMFEGNPNLYSIPVVKAGVPVGLISRYSMIDGFARLYRRELYGRKSCDYFMDRQPLIVENEMRLHALSDLITNMEPHHLSNGFIVTDAGKYIGVGSGHALLREITRMQIDAARYSNPLTMLPGNVPINEHIDRLIEAGTNFIACYFDLDHFKPFNDVYGFRRGDEVIQLTGKLLSEEVDKDIDFVGHVGGDDFIVLFQSKDWQARCNRVLERIREAIPHFYDAKDQAQAGIETEDRLNNRVFYPYISLSVGAVKVLPLMYGSHHEISAAMVSAKKQAKLIAGNSIFIERRTPSSSP
ncbi:putative signaling protein [Methylophilaceae bacterium]|nr:putative signaling protein [Methylophilaceae bacterium]